MAQHTLALILLVTISHCGQPSESATYEDVTVTLTTRYVNLYIEGQSPVKILKIKSDDRLDKYVNGQPLQDVEIKEQNVPVLTKNSVAELPAIEQIAIVFSKVKTIEPGAFKNLPSLTRLDLSGNEIEEIKNGVFNGTTIRWLALENNKISKIEDQAFNNFSMDHLVISHNRISTWRSDWFTGTPMRALTMGHNLLEELPSGAFSFIKRFKDTPKLHYWYVILNDNKLRRIHSGAFDGLDSLGYLNLQNNDLVHLQPGVFGGVEELNNLELNNNEITELDEDLFRGTKFTFVRLQGNELGCLPTNVPKITKIYEVNLEDNPVTCECLKLWKNSKNAYNKSILVGVQGIARNCIEL